MNGFTAVSPEDQFTVSTHANPQQKTILFFRHTDENPLNHFINHQIAPAKHCFPESQRLVLTFLPGSGAMKLTQPLGYTNHV